MAIRRLKMNAADYSEQGFAAEIIYCDLVIWILDMRAMHKPRNDEIGCQLTITNQSLIQLIFDTPALTAL
ncbi:MAG: hypothetical protein LBE50_04910 [Gallionellaceae bacterium]|jgi:hypothetical protein|nr:hypothetical protein [Gallionellaceae bacterium]